MKEKIIDFLIKIMLGIMIILLVPIILTCIILLIPLAILGLFVDVINENSRY